VSVATEQWSAVQEAWVVKGKKHDTAHNESCGNSAVVQWQQLSAAVAVQRVVAVETADR